jgi:hypothetical protein
MAWRTGNVELVSNIASKAACLTLHAAGFDFGVLIFY